MDTIPHFIYELVDPRDDSIFYVGMTIDLYERFRQHMYCDGTNLQKDQRIREIREAGHLPIMRTKEQTFSLSHALEREMHWIVSYQEQGIHLLNIIGISKISQKSVGKGRGRNTYSEMIAKGFHQKPLWKRRNVFVTAETASDEEFQQWVDWNGIPVEDNSSTAWPFWDRLMVINYVFAQGCSLEFADGSILPVNSPTNEEQSTE